MFFVLIANAGANSKVSFLHENLAWQVTTCKVRIHKTKNDNRVCRLKSEFLLESSPNLWRSTSWLLGFPCTKLD